MLWKSRLLLAALAVLVVVTFSLVATTFAQTWQEYRRDEIGFKIEMPGTPRVEEKEAADSKTIKWTNLQLDHKEASLSVSCRQFDKGFSHPPVDAYFDDVRKATEALGVKVTRQNQLAMNGKPVRELFAETDGFYLVARL